MTPPAALVTALAGLDSALRCRWAKATRQWFIERRMPARHPDFLAELRPPPDHDLAWDRYQTLQDGYYPLFTVPADAIHQTERVMASLREWDAATQGSFRAINQRLDAAHEAWERARTAEREDFALTRAEAAADHILWQTHHRLTTSDMAAGAPEPSDHVEVREGYTVRTRKALA